MSGGKLFFRLDSSVREVVFGLEDSLVSTLGMVSGVAVGSGDAQTVVLAGVVLVFVEALSMAAGSYLSSKSSRQVWLSARGHDPLMSFLKTKGLSASDLNRTRIILHSQADMHDRPMLAGLVMGIFYILGGFLVLLPYLFLPLTVALPGALLITVVVLFVLGIWKANLGGLSKLRSGVEMIVISLAAALLGILLGTIIR